MQDGNGTFRSAEIVLSPTANHNVERHRRVPNYLELYNEVYKRPSKEKKNIYILD
jgi:hypothetical protein